MKKLKPWQIVLLVIFYPVGIVYFIVWLIKRSSAPANVRSIDSSKLSVLRDLHTKVVGVTFKNDDTSDRQTIIKNSTVGEDIFFRPMSTSEHPEAVGVFNGRGLQLGYLNADLANELRTKYPTNPMSATISSITGGDEGFNYGCNLHLVIYSTDDAQTASASQTLSADTVFVNKGSKVYHCDQMCAMSRSADCSEMKESEAVKKGLRRCSKCWGK